MYLSICTEPKLIKKNTCKGGKKGVPKKIINPLGLKDNVYISINLKNQVLEETRPSIPSPFLTVCKVPPFGLLPQYGSK